MRKNPGFLIAVLTAAAALAFAAPPPAWQRVVTVRESAGLERTGCPVLVRLDAPEAGGKRPSLRVFAVSADGTESAVPSQVMAVADPLSDVPGISNGTIELCFQADLKSNAVARFVVKPAGGAAPEPADKLAYENGGFGIKVDSGPVQFIFDPFSGQFASYRPKLAGVGSNLVFRQVGKNRPCHWNPDVWVEGQSWGHTSDWNCERPELRPDLAIDRGALAFRMYRRGRIWSAEGVEATVVYTAFAGMPFMLESSSMRFTTNLNVKAIRHNELVFSRGIHTLAVWPDTNGVPQSAALYNKPDPKTFLGKVKTVSADIPWVALANDEKGYGIGVVNVWRKESTLDGSSPRSENACIYFLDYGEHGVGEHYDWNFAYVCRPLYYDDKTPVAIPSGALYQERSAFLAFKMAGQEDVRYRDLLRWVDWLRNPPVITVE